MSGQRECAAVIASYAEGVDGPITTLDVLDALASMHAVIVPAPTGINPAGIEHAFERLRLDLDGAT